MKNNFKKALLTLALAGISTGAVAAELGVTKSIVSSQWLETNDVLDLSTAGPLGERSVSLTLGANYTENDVIKLTFSGASLKGQPQATVNGANASGNITLGLISTSKQDGNSVVVYRVTNVGGNTDQINLNFGGLEFTSAAVSKADGVTVSFAAETNTGLPLDTSGENRSVELVQVINQITPYGGHKFDGTIDVETQRVTFTGEFDSDVSSFHVTPQADENGTIIMPDLFAPLQGRETTLSGNFSWLLDSEGELRPDILQVYCGVGVDSLEVSPSEIVFSCDNHSWIYATASVAFNTATNDVAIPTQSFTYSTTVNLTGADGEVTESLSGDAGEWDLNGSQVNVSYMPYRGDISQVINLSNRTSQAGAVSVTAFPEDGGDPIELGEIANVEANDMVTLAGPIVEALTEATGVDHRTNATIARYALEITTTAPAGSIDVYSAYNVGGSGARLVVNDSNGGAVSKQ